MITSKYRKDGRGRPGCATCPEAEPHLFGTGHFAPEECLPRIAPLVAGFLDQVQAAR